MWHTILGQPLALRVLQSHLVRQRIAPAYLLVGPEGVGKRTAAVEMAKSVNCDRAGTFHAGEEVSTAVGPSTDRGGTLAAAEGVSATAGLPTDPNWYYGPCDACASCQKITRDVHPDVHRLSPHGASESIPIDDVRHLLERVSLRPYMGKRTVAIIDGADRLTEEAANSLLKALEEPPGQTVFLLTTAHPARCLSTIISRCRIVRFQRLTADVIEQLLTRIHPDEPQLARAAGRLAQGSMARAVELCAQWAHHEATVKLLESDGVAAWLSWEMPKDREELSRWLGEAILWLRDVAVAGVADSSLVDHPHALEAIRRQASRVDPDRCVSTALSLVELKTSLDEQSISPRLVGTLLRERWIELLHDS